MPWEGNVSIRTNCSKSKTTVVLESHSNSPWQGLGPTDHLSEMGRNVAYTEGDRKLTVSQTKLFKLKWAHLGCNHISFKLSKKKKKCCIPKIFPSLLSYSFGGVLGFCSGGHTLIITLLYFSSKGLPSSSTFTSEEGTIYLTSEPSALEMQDDNASVLDVYLVSNF